MGFLNLRNFRLKFPINDIIPISSKKLPPRIITLLIGMLCG